MCMTRRLVLLSSAASIVIILVARGAVAQNPIDEALASAYEQLKADPSLQDEQARHRKLMEMADQYSQYAEAAFQATADLQDYSAKVRATGLMFRTPLAKIKQFDKGLKKLTEHPAFKGFQKYAAVKGQASTVLGLGDRLATTLKNPNLPPSARNSLMLLQAVGTGLEQLGEIPLAGPALEGYGQILSGLTDVMNDLAGKATLTTKEGVFSLAEEKERLQGLDPKAQYVKTTLWHRGIPLIQEYPFAAGEDRYYLQMPNGTWIGIPDYDAVASVAADYYLTKKKNPDAETLWKYYNDPEEREKLAFWAETELQFRRVEDVLGDLSGVERSTRYTQFIETEERIKRWHKGLGLPLDYESLNKLIRIEVANPGGVARALRTRVLRAYPGFAEYLASAGEDSQTLEMEALLERFGKYRSGENLAGGALGPDCFLRIPGDLPEGWWQVHMPTDAKNHNDGVPWPSHNAGSTWQQRFDISRDRGFVLQTPTGPWIDPSNRKRRFSSTWVTVLIYAPLPQSSSEDRTKSRVDWWMKEEGARLLNEKKGTVLLNFTQGAGSQHLIKLVFVHRNCDVFIQLSSRPGANSDCTEEMVLQFARTICRHLDEHFAGGKPASPPF